MVKKIFFQMMNDTVFYLVFLRFFGEFNELESCYKKAQHSAENVGISFKQTL